MPTTDVPSPGGWLRTYSVSVAKTLAVGTVAAAATLQMYGPANFKTVPGSSTGAILQVEGLPRYQTYYDQCSGSGGLAGSYTNCSARSPLSTTGSLLAFGVECGNYVVAQPSDVSFKKSLISATGSVLTGGNNITVGTGANLQSQLATPVSWNPVDLLTVASTTAPTGTLNTTRYDCQLWYTVSDKYGS